MRLVNGFDGEIGREDLRLLALAATKAATYFSGHGFRFKKIGKRFEGRADCGDWACRVYFYPPKGMPLSAKIEAIGSIISTSSASFGHALIMDCKKVMRMIEPNLVCRKEFVHWHGPMQYMRFQSAEDEEVIGSAEWWVNRDVHHEDEDEEDEIDTGIEKFEAETEAKDWGWNFGNLQGKRGDWIDFGD